MKFISFGSGSSGNCYYLLEDGIGLIIDAGIGIRSFKKYFREYGFTYPTLKAILVTHDHTDHVKAVGALSGEYNLEVFATEEVHKGILNNYAAPISRATTGQLALFTSRPLQFHTMRATIAVTS